MELIGQRFGHIRVTEVVGQGGMGDVYGGYDEKLERKVALKVLNADQRLDRDARERLLREARALSKIEHPNICRIHDYIESGDVDLLVLEYIDGRTLSDVMAERPSRGERLRIASAVAGVLVAAHRAGIVHRDLKPENVMLTRDGMVKVLDFGLARWLNRARRSSDRNVAAKVVSISEGRIEETMSLPSGYDSAAPVATAVGITLGTPLYMSPEQARGDVLTPASDMYSFGLLLQALFTGEDPHPMGLTAREVILRAARGETNPVQNTPGDVAALIGRLKQFAPPDRPTAVEALAQLHLLSEKPQRVLRRAIVAALILIASIGIWRYMVDLRRERAIAVSARAEADRRRAQAEDLINFMVGDLRTKLEPVGKLDILDDVGKRAIAYIESLDPRTMTADELARNAKALNQLGEVRLAQGNTPAGLQMFRRAERLTKQAVTREPKNGGALMVHGATEFWIGHALWLQARYDEALPHMQNYMQVGETLARLDPNNRDYQLERAYGHSGVALILEAKNQLAGALNHYRVSLEVKEELARRDPDNAYAQAEVARAYNKVGSVLYKMSDLRAALEHSRREVEIYRQLMQREPKQNQWKYRLAASMGYLGRALDETGQSESALALWREELAIERQLAALDPSNVATQRAVAISMRRFASESAKRGDHERAAEQFREARALIARVAPARKSYAVDAVMIDVEYARFLATLGKRNEAAKLLRDGLATLDLIPADDAYARSQRAVAALLLGEILEPVDRRAAEMLWDRAERELAPLVTANASTLELSTWFSILVRRARLPEARAILERLRLAGAATSELEQLCRQSGC